MRLELENGETISNPSQEALRSALRRLDGEEHSFAILDSERGENNYLQVAGGPERSVVEYRETGRHFRCEEILFETVAALFESYRRGDDWWRSGVAWDDVTGEL